MKTNFIHKLSISFFILLIPIFSFISCEDDDMKLPKGTKPEIFMGKWKGTLSSGSTYRHYDVYEFTPNKLIRTNVNFKWRSDLGYFVYTGSDVFYSDWIYDGEEIHYRTKEGQWELKLSLPIELSTPDTLTFGIYKYYAIEEDNIKIPYGTKPEFLIGTWKSTYIQQRRSSSDYYHTTYDFTEKQLTVTTEDYRKDPDTEEYHYIGSNEIYYKDWCYDEKYTIYMYREQEDKILLKSETLFNSDDNSNTVSLNYWGYSKIE